MSTQPGKPDFAELHKRLTAYGLRVFRELGLGGIDTVIPGVGLSVADFVQQVFVDYTLGKIKYHSSKGTLMTVLATALRNDIIDALRLKSHKVEESWAGREDRSDAEDGKGQSLGELPDESPLDILRVLDEAAYKDRIRSSLNGEADLIEVVDAVFELDAMKPEEIAYIIRTTSEDVQNRKKKLRRRLASHGFGPSETQES